MCADKHMLMMEIKQMVMMSLNILLLPHITHNTHHGNKLGQLELQLDSDHLKNINVTSTTKYFKLQL